MAIYYVIPDHCGESRYKLESDAPWTIDDMREFGITDAFASDCAQDYWDNHDGWESSWPLEFHLYESEDVSQPFLKAKVSMEMSPDFSAIEVAA